MISLFIPLVPSQILPRRTKSRVTINLLNLQIVRLKKQGKEITKSDEPSPENLLKMLLSAV